MAGVDAWWLAHRLFLRAHRRCGTSTAARCCLFARRGLSVCHPRLTALAGASGLEVQVVVEQFEHVLKEEVELSYFVVRPSRHRCLRVG